MKEALDTVYMIVCPKNEGVIYSAPAKTKKEAWENALKATADITGWSMEYLQKKGYRAKRISITAAEIIDQKILKLLRALEYIASCKSPGCCRVCGKLARAAIADAKK